MIYDIFRSCLEWFDGLVIHGIHISQHSQVGGGWSLRPRRSKSIYPASDARTPVASLSLVLAPVIDQERFNVQCFAVTLSPVIFSTASFALSKMVS